MIGASVSTLSPLWRKIEMAAPVRAPEVAAPRVDRPVTFHATEFQVALARAVMAGFCRRYSLSEAALTGARRRADIAAIRRACVAFLAAHTMLKPRDIGLLFGRSGPQVRGMIRMHFRAVEAARAGASQTTNTRSAVPFHGAAQ
jgi:chromosomal replication initiation ATPase DnaA